MDPDTEHVYSNSNFGKTLLITGWTLWGLSFVTVCLRWVVKWCVVKRKITVDDYCMAAASTCQLINNVFVTIAVHWGLGRHMAFLSKEQTENALKWILYQEPFGVSTSMFGRIGFAFFLLCIIGVTAKGQRMTLLGIIIVQIVLNIVVVTQIFTQCGNHISANWDSTVASMAHCQSPMVETMIGYVQSAINSASDICLTVIPLLVIRKLQMDIRIKLGLAGLLCLSLFALGASLIKAVAIKNLGERDNFTWNMAYLTLFVVIENNLVIIGASIPTLRSLVKRDPPKSYGQNTYASSQRRPSSPGLQSKKTNKEYQLSTFNTIMGAGPKDCSDEEDLVGLTVPEKARHITKSTNVSVRYEHYADPRRKAAGTPF